MRDLMQELVVHYADLRQQLVRELKDPHRAADIAQSSFERVCTQALDTRPGTSPIEFPRALLFRVARNLCIDEARRRKVALDWVQHGDAHRPFAAPSSECVAAQRQVLARVVDALERLTPRRREVFLLFRAYGHTRTEIAEQLGITEMAVAKHLVRAAVDCSRVLAELRTELIEMPVVYGRQDFSAKFAEDFA